MTEDVETAEITFEVIKIERFRKGQVIAIAEAIITINGIDLLTKGWTISKSHEGVTCRVPVHRRPDTGEWCSSLDLPLNVMEAVGLAVLEAAGFSLPTDEVAGDEAVAA